MVYTRYLLTFFSVFLCSSANAEEPVERKTNHDITIEKFKDYQKVSTDSFSFLLQNKWVVEGIVEGKEGTIRAGTHGETAPFIQIYFSQIEHNASEESREDFRTWQKNTLFSEDPEALQKVLDKSTWHSPLLTYKKNGITIKAVDFEELLANYHEIDEKGNHIPHAYQTHIPTKEPNCTFVRQYHAYRALVNFAALFDGICTATRPEFDAIEKSFVWKK